MLRLRGEVDNQKVILALSRIVYQRIPTIPLFLIVKIYDLMRALKKAMN